MSTSEFTVVQISDLHMDPGDGPRRQRFQEVCGKLKELAPDLIIATGDVTDHGHLREGLFSSIQQVLQQCPAPVYQVPGNHDVGNKAGAAEPITASALAHWIQTFGGDRFSVERGRWALLGLNSQIIGSGMTQEQGQWRWLDEQLDRAEQAGRFVALFMHSPPYIHEPEEELSGGSDYWGFGREACRTFMPRVSRPCVKLLANGHVHWHRITTCQNALWVWCPSVDSIVDDVVFPHGGEALGFMRYRFTDSQVIPQLITLPGPTQKIYFNRSSVEIPGRTPLTLGELVLDFTGTLAKDGRLIDGVASRLVELSKHLRITVLSADTFGTARQSLDGLPVGMQVIQTGADKADYIRRMGAGSIIAIGNGRNDVPALRSAALGIAVVGPEGGAGELIQAAHVVVAHIHDALDLLLNPLRLNATLRC